MQKLKSSRTASFVIVTIIYILASAVGIVSYVYLPFSFWLNLLLADVIATAFTFVFSLIFGNASVYDPYWSVQPIVIAVAFAIGKTLGALEILLLVAILLWGIRLTANWAYTFRSLNFQDWRYTNIQSKTGKLYPLVNFLGIHLVPTLIVYACTLPVVYVLVNGSGKLNIFGVFAFILSVLAVTLQTVSDIQMHRFRKSKVGGFIRIGLWKYSRHPNYLGEILMWWGIGLAVFSAFPSLPYLLIGAFLNTLLFLFISIPMADKRQSAKPNFDSYKRETRMLLPIKK